MAIDTRQNRPPPAQEEMLDAPQNWNASADGRRDTSDSRFSVGASGGRPKWCGAPETTNEPDGDDSTAETGRYSPPEGFGAGH